jgi:cysteinyl-tRNA synthetase
MLIYNTLTRKIEEFKPLNPPNVNLYTCGPTVYDYAHIGHIRTYVGNDVLKRILVYLGYKVKHVMNVTDVGHLTSDEDAGEDKLEKGAKKSGKTVWEVARFFTDYFIYTLKEVNIIPSDILCKATENIDTMIKLIKELEKKGFTYQTDQAVYFDITKFKKYGRLCCQPLEEKLKGAREEVIIDPQKKHPADFALWFKRAGRFADHTMHWNSPWGDGFPGWHIECSAMSMKCLNTSTLDIHTGGVDHIAVHHENEIAQAEAATGVLFVRHWVHFQFLLVEGQKMSKSLGNFYTIDDVKKKGIDPLALRFHFLQTHYRQAMNFTWDSVRGTQEAYQKLKCLVLALRKQTDRTMLSPEKLKKVDEYRKRFVEAISNDMQMPQAVVVMWEVVKSNIPSTDKLDLIYDFDQVLGLKLTEVEEEKIPDEITNLADRRQKAREDKDFAEADRLRKEVEKKGYLVEDTPSGCVIKKIY